MGKQMLNLSASTKILITACFKDLGVRKVHISLNQISMLEKLAPLINQIQKDQTYSYLMNNHN